MLQRGDRHCRLCPMPSAKWKAACPSTHTQSSQPGFSFMGLLPNATFGPNYQVVSITWTSSWFPSVKLLMRFGLATARISICLLTLPFCLSGTGRETGSPSSWQPSGHREGRHVLPHRCSQHKPQPAPRGAFRR